MRREIALSEDPREDTAHSRAHGDLEGMPNSRGSLRSLLQLFHPIPVLLTIVAAAAFAIVGGPGIGPGGVLPRIIITVALSQIAIAVFNDICDRESDRVARPQRAVAGGVVGVGWAYFLTVVTSAGSLAAALSFGRPSAALVGLGLASGLMYSALFKGTIMSWLPFAVAFPLLPYWEFFVLRNGTPMLWATWAVGAPVAVAIHIADSLPDLEGDRRSGSQGLVTHLGTAISERVSFGLLLVSVAFMLVLTPDVSLPAFALGGIVCAGVCLTVAGWRRLPSARRYGVPVAGICLAVGWLAAIAS